MPALVEEKAGDTAKVMVEADNWDVLKPEAHTDSMCLYLGLPRVVV